MNENIIKIVCSEMNQYLNNYQMSKLNETLYKRLDSNDNEISNNEYLDKYISSKKLEGCSDLTIRNYNTHIIKLFEYLNNFLPMETSNIPIDSLIREFIGSGCFNR